MCMFKCSVHVSVFVILGLSFQWKQITFFLATQYPSIVNICTMYQANNFNMRHRVDKKENHQIYKILTDLHPEQGHFSQAVCQLF